MPKWRDYDPASDGIDSIAEFALRHDVEYEEAEEIANENRWFRPWREYDPAEDGIKTVTEFAKTYNMSRQGAYDLADRHGWFPDRRGAGSPRVAKEADAGLAKLVPSLDSWTPTGAVVGNMGGSSYSATLAALKRAEKAGMVENEKRGPRAGGHHWRKKR